MQTPMVGTWSVNVKAVRPFTIHSDLYYELHILRDDSPEQLMSIRAPQHAFTSEPQPGERLTLTFLMGQVTEARRET